MSDTTLYNRVSQFPVICGIQLAYAADILPSVIEGWQPFNNAIINDGELLKAYIGLATVSFTEKSETPSGGVQYRQKLSVQFPVTDKNRAIRLEQIHKVRFIKIMLSTGKSFLIGRNDYNQNARPVIQVEANEHLAQIGFETVSIFATGYTPTQELGGLPDGVPVDLIEG